MRAFLATVLSVIAAGVLLVAYGLLAPRAAAAPDALTYAARPDFDQTARPMVAAERVTLPDGTTGIVYVDPNTTAAPVYGAPAYASAPAYATPVVRTMPVAQTESYVPVRRASTVRVDREPRRNWTKTALTIGGSTAAGAGIGAIVGGGKGAAIGAALGGGASTLFEALHH